jgi:putative transposase
MREPTVYLDDFINSNPDARELKRALAVKYTKLGKNYREIIELLNVSLGFISKWRQIYEAEGVTGLKLGYEGRVSYLKGEETEAIIAWLKQGNSWRLEQLQEHIEQEYGVVYKARRSYYELFKRAGISWKKTQKGNPKKDPEQVAVKQAEIKKTDSMVSGNSQW